MNVVRAWYTASMFGKRLHDGGREGNLCLTGSERLLGMQHVGVGLQMTTKMAVLGLADVLRAELPATIGSSVLCPGPEDTELHLSRRHGPLPQAPGSCRRLPLRSSPGMAANDVGRAALDEVECGDFLIHPRQDETYPATNPRSSLALIDYSVQIWLRRLRWHEVRGFIGREGMNGLEVRIVLDVNFLCSGQAARAMLQESRSNRVDRG